MSTPPTSPLIASRLLLPLRILWVVTLVITLTALAASMPVLYDQAHQICRQVSCNGPQLTPQQVHAFHRAGLSLDTFGIMVAAVNAIFALLYCAIATFIFVRRSGERMALLSAYFLVVFGGLTFPGTTWAIASRYPALQIPAGLTHLLGAGLLVLFFALFPNGRFVPSWSRWLVPILPILQAPDSLFPESSFTLDKLPVIVGIVPFLGTLAVLIWTQVYRFRAISTPLERQQTKWVVLGVGTGIAGFIVLVAANIFLPSSLTTGVYAVILPQVALYAFMLLIPLSIALAVLRYNLWEADTLINRTLVYGSLTLSLGGIYLLGVVGIQSVFRAATGQTSELAVAIATLGIAAAFNPWRRRVQSFIDRRFYRRKYDAQRVLGAFSRQLRDEVDLDRLRANLVAAAHETIEPTTVSLWLRDRGETA